MARSILDYNVVQPGHERAGAEPTLRMLIHAYYDKARDEKDKRRAAA